MGVPKLAPVSTAGCCLSRSEGESSYHLLPVLLFLSLPCTIPDCIPAPPEARQQLASKWLLSEKSLDAENIPLCLSVPEIGSSLCRAGNFCPAAVQGGIRDSWLERRSSLCIWLPSSLIKTLRNSWFYKTLLPEGLWGSRMPRNLLTTSSSQKQQE